MEDSKIGVGWIFPNRTNTRKWHFFSYDKRSLCMNYGIFSNRKGSYGNDNSKDNCKRCLVKLIKLREKSDE